MESDPDTEEDFPVGNKSITPVSSKKIRPSSSKAGDSRSRLQGLSKLTVDAGDKESSEVLNSRVEFGLL